MSDGGNAYVTSTKPVQETIEVDIAINQHCRLFIFRICGSPRVLIIKGRYIAGIGDRSTFEKLKLTEQISILPTF